VTRPAAAAPTLPRLPPAAVTAGLLVGIVAVSTSAILARVAMGDEPGIASAGEGAAPALAVAFWRTLLGALALAPFGVRAARRRGVPIGARRHRQLAASGLALGLHFALFQGSLALTTVASAVTLATMSPVFVALGGWWLLKEPTDRRTWVGMAITMVGAVTIGAGDLTALDLGARALVGDAMAFGSAIAVTGYLLLGRVARRDVPATTYSASVFAWAAVALLPVCLLTGTPLGGFEPVTWAAIAGIVVGPQLLGHTVFNALLSTVPATVVSIVVLAEPVGAGVLAWLLLAELPTGWFYLGAPLVLLGVAIATVRRRPGPMASAEPV
jgi:drug/metabolite transporter (DMT)-like permease